MPRTQLAFLVTYDRLDRASVFLPESQQADTWGVIPMAEFDCSLENTDEHVLYADWLSVVSAPASALTQEDVHDVLY